MFSLLLKDLISDFIFKMTTGKNATDEKQENVMPYLHIFENQSLFKELSGLMQTSKNLVHRDKFQQNIAVQG